MGRLGVRSARRLIKKIEKTMGKGDAFWRNSERMAALAKTEKAGAVADLFICNCLFYRGIVAQRKRIEVLEKLVRNMDGGK